MSPYPQLHKLLLDSPYEGNAITPDGQPTKRRIQVGQYKSAPNHVETVTGEIFRCARRNARPARGVPRRAEPGRVTGRGTRKKFCTGLREIAVM